VPARGTAWSQGDLNQLRPGKTTKKDVRALLGRPHKSDQSDLNRQEWTYYYSHEQSVQHLSIQGTNLDGQREWKVLTLHFNLNGILIDSSVQEGVAQLDSIDKQGGIQPKPPISFKK
jgi:outer membrane protein assembly factor BamE (lipoprotein component of BamABCDE complex)